MRFTVFTPVYNRRDTIHRVWDSLLAQTFRDFEWVVVDDGSEDGVGELLADYRTTAPFPMKVLTQANRGKHVAWNRAIEIANGEFFVTVDSDDAIIPTALERLDTWWRHIPDSDLSHFLGIMVLCQDARTGAVVGDSFPQSPMVSDSLEVVYIHRVRGEKWGCDRTDALRKRPFPETRGARYFPESYLWLSLARTCKKLCVNEALRIYHTDTANGITRKGQTLSSFDEKHYLYEIWHLGANYDYLRHRKWMLCKVLTKLWVSALVMKHPVRKVLADLGGTRKFRAMALCGFPVAFFLKYVMSLRGRMQESSVERVPQ